MDPQKDLSSAIASAKAAFPKLDDLADAQDEQKKERIHHIRNKTGAMIERLAIEIIEKSQR